VAPRPTYVNMDQEALVWLELPSYLSLQETKPNLFYKERRNKL
jgi:hypothetical protein